MEPTWLVDLRLSSSLFWQFAPQKAKHSDKIVGEEDTSKTHWEPLKKQVQSLPKWIIVKLHCGVITKT